MTDPVFTHDEQVAIDLYCAGDRDFFVTYRQSCIDGFRADLDAGDHAVAQADGPTLRRAAHSLKGVLTSIGQPGLSALAADVEHQVDAAAWSAACAGWSRLAQAMRGQYGFPAGPA